MRQRRDVSPWTLSGLTRGMNCNLTTKMVRQEDGEFENILSWSVKLCLKRKKKASSLGRILDYLSPPTCSIHSLCAQWDIPKCYLCRPNRAPTYQRSPVWDEYTFKKKTGRGHMYMFPPTHSRKKNSHPVFFFCQNLFCLEKPLYNQGQTKRLKEQETSQNNPKEQGQENPVQIASALPSPARNSLGCTESCNVRAHFSFPHSLVKLLAFP